MAYLGKTPSQAVRSRYFYTAAGGETSLSGADDNNDTLIFADGNYVDVYLNGVLLVAGSDYNVNTVNTISGLTALVALDVVEIVVYDTFAVFGGTFQGTLTANSFAGDLLGAVDFLAKNKTGSTIPAGTPVYIAGNTGNDIEIDIADADDPAKMPAFGITSASIGNNAEGKVITYGRINDFDTSAFALGDELYVSTTGTLTATRPTGSTSLVQKVAKVVRNQQNNGILFVTGAGRSNDTPNAITANSINLGSTTTVSGVLDEDTMISDSATSLATQQSIKAYVDSQIGANNELSEVLSNGNTTDGTDIAFGDNDKAIFNTDLSLYHTGGNAYIAETGAGGSLWIGADNNVFIANSAFTEYKAAFATNGAVTLYHDNSAKIATTSTGVDVTGAVTTDGLTVDGLSTLQNVTVGVDGTYGGNYRTIGFGGNTNGSTRIFGTTDDSDNLYLAAGTGRGINLWTDGSSATRMKVDTNGFVGIGTASPSRLLSLNSSNASIDFSNGTWKNEIINSSGQMEFRADHTNAAASSVITFSVDGTEAARIDSSQNLLVGKISSSSNTAGFEARPDGLTVLTRSGNRPLVVNRLINDGELALLQKDGATVGSIGTLANNLWIGTGNTALRFGYAGLNAIVPWNTTTNSLTDGTTSLGYSSTRFTDLHLSGGVYLGGTGSANKLDDYEEGDYDATVTPSTSGSITLNGAYNRVSYTKVGRLVTVNGFLIVDSVSSPVGYFTINLPFVSASLTDRAGDSAASLVIQNVSSSNISDFMGTVNEASSNMNVQLGDGTTTQNDSAQQILANTYIMFNLTYPAA